MPAQGGYKTRQRDLILQCLQENHDRHLTAEDIMQLLDLQGTRVGKATVYRYLDRLVQQELIHKYTMENGQSACYEYRSECTGTNHEQFHLKCVCCGKLLHLHCAYLKDLQEHIQQEHTFLIDPYKTVFYGRCKDCQQQLDLQKDNKG